MDDFDWTKFTRKIAIRAEKQEIYNAWTAAGEVEKWFLRTAVFSEPNGNRLDKKDRVSQGSSYEWEWYLYDETERGTITEANGTDHIQFTFAGQCLVDIKLSNIDEFVMVELTQRNIPTDDCSKKEIRLGCDSGWSFYLLNLKSVYEGGIDLRNKDNRLKGMVNN